MSFFPAQRKLLRTKLQYQNDEILQNNPKILKILQRPLPRLPRRHFLMLKCGPVPLADLSVFGKSIFDESKIVPRISVREETPVVAKEGKKGKKIVEWSTKDFKKISKTSGNLISILKEKAIAFGQTGIDPDLLESVRNAMYSSTQKKVETDLTFENSLSNGNFNAYIRSQSPVDAFATVDKLVALGIDSDDSIYVSLIIVCGANADLARKAFLKMRAQLIPSSEKVYAVLIRSHIVSGDLVSGFNLLRKMESENIALTCPIIPTILINGLIKLGKIELARDLFQNFRTWKQIIPDSVLFSVMIKSCIFENECERASAYYEDMKLSNQFATDITYTHLIDCMSRRLDFTDKAKEFWNQMQLEGYGLNGIVATSLVRIASLHGNLAELERTFNFLTMRNIPISPQMYVLAIECIGNSVSVGSTDFEKNDRLRLAWTIIDDIKAKGLSINTQLLNGIAKLYVACNENEHAMEICSEFEKFNVKPNSDSYLILLCSMKSEVGRFFPLYDKMLADSSVTISAPVLHLALDAAMASQSSKRTVAVLEQMLERKIYPLPDAAGKLAVVGRKIVQIHQVVGKLVAMNRDSTYDSTVKRQSLISLEIEEHRAKLAKEGMVDTDSTLEEQVRLKYFKKGFSNLRLSKSEHLERKKKGGKTHAKKIDKVAHNIIAE